MGPVPKGVPLWGQAPSGSRSAAKRQERRPLRTAALWRLRTLEESYESLSGYYYLRFFNPAAERKTGEANHEHRHADE